MENKMYMSESLLEQYEELEELRSQRKAANDSEISPREAYLSKKFTSQEHAREDFR